MLLTSGYLADFKTGYLADCYSRASLCSYWRCWY